jgi:Rrf2 family protein
VKALLDLALLEPTETGSVRAIACRQQIPAPFLEKLLIEMRQAGLVRSQRGAQGGYQLAKSLQAISLADILKAVGERVEPLADGAEDGQAEDWVMQAVWQQVSLRLQQALEEITLEDLYFDARSWQAAQGNATEFVV